MFSLDCLFNKITRIFCHHWLKILVIFLYMPYSQNKSLKPENDLDMVFRWKDGGYGSISPVMENCTHLATFTAWSPIRS